MIVPWDVKLHNSESLSVLIVNDAQLYIMLFWGCDERRHNSHDIVCPFKSLVKDTLKKAELHRTLMN